MANVTSTAEGGIGTEYTSIERIDPDDITDSDGKPVGFDEFRQLSAGQVDAAYFDGGSPTVYPQLGLSEEEGKIFEHGLVRRVYAMQKSIRETPWQADWLIEAGGATLSLQEMESAEQTEDQMERTK